MTVHDNHRLESWLTVIGSDASGWLATFAESPFSATADLLWNRFYFGALNVLDRGQLLATWLDILGETNQFAQFLDEAFDAWINEHWGAFNHDSDVLSSAWSCLLNVVEFSSNLPDSQLSKSAATLRQRFAERQRFLGSFSSGPASDPLGLYLGVVAEFQGSDRSLAPLWHNLCHLPDGVPIYHARYAMLGLRRMREEDPLKNGVLSASVVLGLIDLARAFDRLVRERGLSPHIAASTFGRVAWQTAVAYPDSSRWREFGLADVFELSETPRRWLLNAVAPLAEAVRREKNQRAFAHPAAVKSIKPSSSWWQRSQDIASRLSSGDRAAIQDAKLLLFEERRYAEITGDSYDIVHSLRNLARRVTELDSELAVAWASEARTWAPYDAYSWTTLTTVYRLVNNPKSALAHAWVAWKRFPENVYVHTTLAEALKAADFYKSAEMIYRQAAQRFPENSVPLTGLGEVLKERERFAEAESIYREAIERFPTDIWNHNGLAETLRRRGNTDEAERVYRRVIEKNLGNPATYIGLAQLLQSKGPSGRQEALRLVNKVLQNASDNRYAQNLKRELTQFGEEHHQTKPEIFEVLESKTDALVQPISLPEKQEDSALEIAAIVAEASFYRGLAKRTEGNEGSQFRQRATTLLQHAQKLSPADDQVLAERAALIADEGDTKRAFEELNSQIGSHSASIPLLILRARLDRYIAKQENRPLNEATLSDLCAFPQRLKELDSTLAPLFHFQKGLATLALHDGVVRMRIAAEAFSGFRRQIARRAMAERTDSAKARHQQETGPYFHEWLQEQVSARVFIGADSDDTEISPDEIPEIEVNWRDHSSHFEEIEDVFSDRLMFGAI